MMMFGKRRRYGERTFQTWIGENWFRLAVLLVAATGGVYSFQGLLAQKADREDLNAVKDSVSAVMDDVALLRLEVIRNDSIQNLKLDDIISIQCIGQPRAPGCQRVRR